MREERLARDLTSLNGRADREGGDGTSGWEG